MDFRETENITHNRSPHPGLRRRFDWHPVRNVTFDQILGAVYSRGDCRHLLSASNWWLVVIRRIHSSITTACEHIEGTTHCRYWGWFPWQNLVYIQLYELYQPQTLGDTRGFPAISQRIKKPLGITASFGRTPASGVLRPTPSMRKIKNPDKNEGY
jgi:hypothetical protein